MPRLFFTADTHFGHAGIIAMCDRPFSDIDEHDGGLIEAWNAVVGPDDVVWHLGDFAYRERAGAAAQIFSQLNGVKHLILGNHDHGKGGKLSATQLLPWASQQEQCEVVVEDGTTLVLNHYSLRVWRNMRRGAVQLYGHSHGRLPGNSQSIDVGVDNFGYAPATWPEIRARLALGPPLIFRDDSDEVGDPETVTWSFAIGFRGQLHVIPMEMPPAENLVVVRMTNRSGIWVMDADAAQPLRALLGTPSIREVVRHTGPAVHAELEDLLRDIEAMIGRRVDRLRGDVPDDDDAPGGPKP